MLGFHGVEKPVQVDHFEVFHGFAALFKGSRQTRSERVSECSVESGSPLGQQKGHSLAPELSIDPDRTPRRAEPGELHLVCFIRDTAQWRLVYF